MHFSTAFFSVFALFYLPVFGAPANPRAASPTPTNPDNGSSQPNRSNALFVHDPGAIFSNGHYYVFAGAIEGTGVPYFKSDKDTLDGPWTKVGEVLASGSKIHEVKEKSQAPWAPAIIQKDNTFYVFYATTHGSTRDSAIGVAACENLDAPDTWIDYGAILYTGQGPDSDKYPFTVSNAIDPSVLMDPKSGTAILQYGSYWDGIFQVPLSDDLRSLRNPNGSFSSSHIAFNGAPPVKGKAYHLGPHPIEGSALTYHSPYYYVYYAHGACCGLHKVANTMPLSDVYEIRVGRSNSVSGPFVDKDGVNLLQGGGSVFLASHDDVYAPGGPSVMKSPSGTDIFYYHYLNRKGDLQDKHALLGWDTLTYGDDGWPQLSSTQPNGGGANATSSSAGASPSSG